MTRIITAQIVEVIRSECEPVADSAQRREQTAENLKQLLGVDDVTVLSVADYDTDKGRFANNATNSVSISQKSVRVKISNFNEVKQLLAMANSAPGDVTVIDVGNSRADAHSLLGLMSLRYDSPVTVYSDDDNFLAAVANAFE